MKDRIRQLMESQHMNQQAFAKYTNIGVASLSSIFTGRTKPTMNHLVAIMDAFPNVNPTWLIKGEGAMMNSGTPQPSSSILDAFQDSSLQGMTESSADSPSVSREGTAQTKGASPQQGSLFNENSFFGDGSSVASTNTNPAVESTNRYQGAQMRQQSMRNGTDNMAVPKSYATPSNGRGLRTVSQVGVVQAPPSLSRKITEIRVFYDDQTWESFVPKK